jgi:hypothetical protein
MAETYKSQATKLTSTSNTTIYSGVAGVGIVNSINLSNVDAAAPVNVSVFLVKSSVSYSIISNTDIPYGTSLQILDAPLVCASGDTITATASIANDVECIVSVLEIT